jgi:hypothetical protein
MGAAPLDHDPDPLLFLGLVELGLRIVGYGYKTAPMLPYDMNARRAFGDNLRYPWRFSRPISPGF